jgi:hypothetical protein
MDGALGEDALAYQVQVIGSSLTTLATNTPSETIHASR